MNINYSINRGGINVPVAVRIIFEGDVALAPDQVGVVARPVGGESGALFCKGDRLALRDDEINEVCDAAEQHAAVAYNHRRALPVAA
jgi:hypothetical protein